MKSEPKDLVINYYGITLTFASWYMAYDKGANAGVQVKVDETTKQGENFDRIFDQTTEIKVNMQRLINGMTYKDLMDLSEWAKKSAKFLKSAQIKYRGKENFEKEHMKNELVVRKKNETEQ